MKRLTLGLLAIATCIVTDGFAFGQTPQGSDCNQGECQSNGIYQPTQWNNCESCNTRGGHGPMHRQASQCRPAMGSRFASMWTQPLFPGSCAAKCCATKGPPDAGWNPPAHMPVNYDGAWYGCYLPQHAYGTPGGGFIANYPTVYQPTDTTQLGYYYNKVPTWQTRSDMIPGVPYPGDYHARVCPQGGAGGHGCYGATYNAVSYGPTSSSCQNCNSGHYSAIPQYPSPNRPRVVRAAQPQRRGLLEGFRLASMTELFD
jgi:hypothetical protein